MVYKYCENQNFEDFASGKVIVHRTGFPAFPVRLAQEIFGRCISYLDHSDRVCLYDPCCGGGYLLTVLGFLNADKIHTFIASDISDEAVKLADQNLSLLHKSGLEQRIRQLEELRSCHNKDSHADALKSAVNLCRILTDSAYEIEHSVFRADVLSGNAFDSVNFKADILFTDVPYGNLTKWQNKNEESVNLLDCFLPVVKDHGIVAICSDKSQKFQSEHYERVEKQLIGKRLFQIFRLKQP